MAVSVIQCVLELIKLCWLSFGHYFLKPVKHIIQYVLFNLVSSPRKDSLSMAEIVNSLGFPCVLFAFLFDEYNSVRKRVKYCSSLPQAHYIFHY